MDNNKRGRKSTVTLSITYKDVKLSLKKNKIKDYFFSSVRPMTSGAYIPISQKYKHHKVIILVLQNEEVIR